VRPESPATAVAVVNLASNVLIVVGVPLVGLSFALPGNGRLGIGAAALLWLTAILFVPGTRELDSGASRLVAIRIRRPAEAGSASAEALLPYARPTRTER
jgi:hypothetical protein